MRNLRMKLYIKNKDEVETLLFTSLRKEQPLSGLAAFNPDPPPPATSHRMVLRPGEDGNYDLEKDYFLGVEKL
jgi:hypothetical protein